MSSSLLADLESRAKAAGMNLFGLVDAELFDRGQATCGRAARLLSGCGTIVVLGSGGRGFWEEMVRSDGLPRSPDPRYHPIQEFAVKNVRAMQEMLRQHGIESLLVQPEDKQTLSFVRLAEAAGFGTASPVIGLLLNPRYGPWVSMRAALLLPGTPFGPMSDASIVDTFQPCTSCGQPCVSACPIHVHDGFGHADFRRCAVHRSASNCMSGCSVRRACPVGSDQRYGAEEEAHRHAYSLFTMQKWYGLGGWRFVPRFLRQ
jgi:hypothetical protein